MKLLDITFPVFTLPKSPHKIWEEFNVLYMQTESGKLYILDNKNLSGKNLGIRRAKIDPKDLYKHKRCYYSISQLLKSTYSKFIDYTGKVFQYTKTTMVPLKYHKLKDIKAIENFSILSFYNTPYILKIRTSPKVYDIKYVGLLYTDFGLIPYEFSDEPKKDTRRKI